MYIGRTDIIKYTNNDIINLSKYVNQVYCANIDTINILKDVYNITATHLNFNYIPYINKTYLVDPKWKNREYDIAIIISNFNRKII